jgi:hypothetical protein
LGTRDCRGVVGWLVVLLVSQAKCKGE